MIWLVNSIFEALDRLERRSKFAAWIVMLALLAIAVLGLAYLNADRFPVGYDT
ncbi:hypothetical protein [Burkholderia stagnalis]|uniref:hypothetical protein n=1 Tax=Burkholderia stagnalis TaxID=1503054 RepID=UPI00325B98AC